MSGRLIQHLHKLHIKMQVLQHS
ncbi:hypothetical protein QMS71_21240 [Cronobacter sakazakii]|nr:hypothetical protein [Cronobacter sakazakii]MDI7598933.1 hypothetical protein [Cronobacter sakazakii]MDK1037045.1 hypothetical protein [Cronobacter sakazakii]MDK1123812.1 hypothetical protein [Cronobacter sakazakii]MDT3632397.1 hypothetical protein [Cronobacter sakazakii]